MFKLLIDVNMFLILLQRMTTHQMRDVNETICGLSNALPFSSMSNEPADGFGQVNAGQVSTIRLDCVPFAYAVLSRNEFTDLEALRDFSQSTLHPVEASWYSSS